VERRCDVVVCPPSSIFRVSEALKGSGFASAAEHAFWRKKRYTGEVSADMLKSSASNT
jgi:triosephosphate isomerase